MPTSKSIHSRFSCDDPDRRDVLFGGGALALGAILTSLLGTARPAVAAPITGGVPELDRIAVRIVVEDFQFAVGPGKKLDGLVVENFGWGLSPDHPPGRTLVSEFGLGMHVETHRAAETRQILVDFGFTPEALNNNISMLKIDPGAIDAMVLSHGHYDHFGGLAGFLEASAGTLKAKLPSLVGGEDCFCARQWTAPPVKGDLGVIDRRALEAASLTVTATPQPALIGDHGFTSGRIAEQSFEKLKSPSMMKLGMAHGSGCEASGFSAADQAKGSMPNQFDYEIATAFNLRARVSSYSPRAAIAASSTPSQRRRRSPASRRSMRSSAGCTSRPIPRITSSKRSRRCGRWTRTISCCCNCSGDFYDKARATMPGKVVHAYTGTRLVFDA